MAELRAVLKNVTPDCTVGAGPDEGDSPCHVDVCNQRIFMPPGHIYRDRVGVLSLLRESRDDSTFVRADKKAMDRLGVPPEWRVRHERYAEGAGKRIKADGFFGPLRHGVLQDVTARFNAGLATAEEDPLD